jgi:beta-lactamase superfamily II metal-dependent hydrolase
MNLVISRCFIIFSFACFSLVSYATSRSHSIESVVVNPTAEEYIAHHCAPSCLKKFQDIGINVNDGNLYIVAFNVGQANFIILKKENRVVIVDAGMQKGFQPEFTGKLDNLLSGATVEAVFITHPHLDHFSLIGGCNIDLLKLYKAGFQNTIWFKSRLD